MLELTLTKVRQQHLGVIFKQEQTCITVDNITPQTPAAQAGLKPGDTILAVENRNVTSISQISKIIKSISGVNVTLRVERIASDYIFKSKQLEKTELKTPITTTINVDDTEGNCEPDSSGDTVCDSLELSKKFKSLTNIEKVKSDKVPKLISASNENMSKFAQTIGSFSLRKRKQSMERASNESSTKSTPTASSPGTPQHSFKQHLIMVPSNIMTKKHSISEVPEIVRTDLDTQDVEILSSIVECYRGKEVSISSIMTFNDEYAFNLKDSHKYLNANVWGTTPAGKDVLLGYTNISLTEILNECCSSMLGHYIRTYSFLPPNNVQPNK